MANILCTGLLVADTIVKPVTPEIFASDTMVVDEVQYSTGGDAMNQAIVLARLGNSAAIAGMVGRDTAGDNILRTLQNAGVSTTHVQRSATYGTSCSILLCTAAGERHILYHPGANAAFALEEPPDLAGYDAVTIGSLYAAPKMDRGGWQKLLQQAKEAGLVTVADMTVDAYSLPQEYITGLLPLVDYLCPSLAEGVALTGESTPQGIVQALRAMGANTVVVKNGAKGCLVYDGEEMFAVPTYTKAPVVDTTGAGDNFTAGFTHAILQGMPPRQAAQFGCAVASVAVGGMGAVTAVQSEAQVLRFMEQYKQAEGEGPK